MASSHLRRFSFQFVHCRSFRVRRRHCFIYFEIAIGQVVEDSCLYEDKDIPVPVISPPFTLSFRYLCTMHQCSSFDDASAVVHFVLGTDNTLQSKVQSQISQRRSTYCSILRFRIEQYFHLLFVILLFVKIKNTQLLFKQFL